MSTEPGDPCGNAIHAVFEAVAELYRQCPSDAAHWFAASAIFAAERESRKVDVRAMVAGSYFFSQRQQ